METIVVKKPRGFQKGHPILRGPITDREIEKLSIERRGKGNPMYKGGKQIASKCQKSDCAKLVYDYVPHKFCSKICAVTAPERRDLQRKNAMGNKAHWKGDAVGYFGLHDWVARELGKPRFCEHCGNRELSHRQYHWANKSGKYKRILSDWLRLCVKCHKKYDTNR